jgi:hypothetical protein
MKRKPKGKRKTERKRGWPVGPNFPNRPTTAQLTCALATKALRQWLGPRCRPLALACTGCEYDDWASPCQRLLVCIACPHHNSLACGPLELSYWHVGPKMQLHRYPFAATANSGIRDKNLAVGRSAPAGVSSPH